MDTSTDAPSTSSASKSKKNLHYYFQKAAATPFETGPSSSSAGAPRCAPRIVKRLRKVGRPRKKPVDAQLDKDGLEIVEEPTAKKTDMRVDEPTNTGINLEQKLLLIY